MHNGGKKGRGAQIMLRAHENKGFIAFSASPVLSFFAHLSLARAYFTISARVRVRHLVSDGAHLCHVGQTLG